MLQNVKKALANSEPYIASRPSNVAIGGKADITLIGEPRSLIVLPPDSTIGSAQWAGAMGYNQRNDEIRDNISGCAASAKPMRMLSRPFANSTRDFRPRNPRGSGRRLPPRSRQNIIG
jgi:hypothetical protein